MDTTDWDSVRKDQQHSNPGRLNFVPSSKGGKPTDPFRNRPSVSMPWAMRKLNCYDPALVQPFLDFLSNEQLYDLFAASPEQARQRFEEFQEN